MLTARTKVNVGLLKDKRAWGVVFSVMSGHADCGRVWVLVRTCAACSKGRPGIVFLALGGAADRHR